MTAYLLDTSAYVRILQHGAPEKWDRSWSEIQRGRSELFLFEYLIGELFNCLVAEGFSQRRVRQEILRVKKYPAAKLSEPDDEDAMRAGHLRHKINTTQPKEKSISLVDSFILTLAKKHRAEILTTDHGIRDAGKSLAVKVNWLPREEHVV